ncbi:MAG: hypothetical protein P9M14_01910 [Candidatus Alcyoniella australis]|nr:hypothetical protein [Candidatus Alcyoniella australis]
MSDKKLDDIFESTAPKKKAGAKKAAAKKTAAQKTAAKSVKADPAVAAQADALDIPQFSVLKMLFLAHNEEVLYRRAREERAMILCCALCGALALLAVIAFGGPWGVAGWFWRLVFKVLLIAGVFMAASSGSKLIEVNRKRLQDLLGLQVKISNILRLYDEGTYADEKDPLYPGTFKFLGSLADDETNIGSLLIKGAFLFASLVIIFA